ncbi:hypothetical protein FB567DRAFT_593518 [Paraphoma chrysanthemicola]|uniref:DUF7730 domain-containing protein n=1 Tax=Paraphoma chrysanthemicola TaxID=798071 RepID=A0A8K0VXN8_9PLEO|nr:hypothetical protein FB567DRAFT_593518 [Paraphoma chrysanthemicola]
MSTRSRALAMPIAAGCSAPVNASESSFLTTIPPELRNAIYLAAFAREGYVEIVSALELKKQPAWEVEDVSGHNSYHEENEVNEVQQSLEDTMKAPCAYHEVFPVALLRSCRQVYREAVGVLYGRNSFLIRGPSHRHNPADHHLNTTVAWIRSLGSLIPLINHVTIETSLVCPDICNYSCMSVQLGPLASLLWSMPYLQPRVNFGSIYKQIDPRLHPVRSTLVQHNYGWFDAATLNAILDNLIGADRLNIRRYARSLHLMSEIAIDCGLKDGYVVFPVTFNGHRIEGQQTRDLTREFSIDRNGETIAWIDPMETPNLLGVPYEIIRSIVEQAVYSSDVVVFDVDQRNVSGLELQCFAVCRDMSYITFDSIFASRKMVLRKRIRYAEGRWPGLNDLVHWLDGPGNYMFPQLSNVFLHCIVLKTPPVVEILIEDLTEYMSPKGVNLNVTNFIMATFEMVPTTILRLIQAPGLDDGTAKLVFTFSIQKLRKYAFMLLSELMISSPEQGGRECPEIWISSDLEFIEIAFPAGAGPEREVVRSLDRGFATQRSEEDVSALAKKYIEDLEPADQSRAWPEPGLETYHLDGTLFPIWRVMRDRDWHLRF